MCSASLVMMKIQIKARLARIRKSDNITYRLDKKQPNSHERLIYYFENGLTLYNRVENDQILNLVIHCLAYILGMLLNKCFWRLG